tara:strand:- start:557 stop:1444 length:888 start_codon:yes stop_codon:yes gene_type:complete
MTLRTGENDVASDINALAGIRPVKRNDENPMPLWTSNFSECNLSGWYAGRSAFLIGGGPSLNDHDLSKLRHARGIVTMGMNNSWALYKPDLWTCVDTPNRFIDTGWKDPSITKFCPMGHWNTILKVQNKNGMTNSSYRAWQMPSTMWYLRSQYFDPDLYLDEDRVCWGGPSNVTDALGIKGKRSVFQAAFKLLVYLGFKNIYCIGTDFKMSAERKYAFGEHRDKNAIRHNNELYSALIKRMKSIKGKLADKKVKVRVCCPDSGLLDAFPYMPFEDAVEQASNECSKVVNTQGWYT